MLKDFGTLTKELQPQLPDEPRTKPLMKQDGLSVYLDKKEHKLKVFCEILLDTEKKTFLLRSSNKGKLLPNDRQSLPRQ